MELNPMLKGLAFLVGKWECKKGAGFFPTITTFGYKDTVEFRQVGGQPLLAYSAWSSHPEKGAPMHLESGFLRATGDSGDGNTKLAFMVAHNFGIVTRTFQERVKIRMKLMFHLFRSDVLGGGHACREED